MFRIVLAITLLTCGLTGGQAFAQAAVYIVRHAERANNAVDSPLSEQGKQRADALARLLKQAKVKAIYTSQFVRSQKTAEPLATKLDIRPVIVNNGDPDKTASLIRTDHPHDVVLVVGHSDTVGPLIKNWDSEAAVTISENEFDAIFILIPTGNSAGWIRLKYASGAP
jgi:phosphohistidine phosphatase SixA